MRFSAAACILLLGGKVSADSQQEVTTVATTPNADFNRVLANHKVTVCDIGASAKKVFGVDCGSERRHLSDAVDSESLKSQSFASFEDGAVLTIIPFLLDQHLDEEHEVMVNFGEDVLFEISRDDLAEKVEIVVIHSEGTTTKTIPSVSDLLDVRYLYW